MSSADQKPKSYFACTLGEAEIFNTTLPPAPYSTINGFLDHLVQRYPHAVAVGCAGPGQHISGRSDEEWNVETLTFLEIQQLSQSLAGHLLDRIDDSKSQQTVALYASSSLAYLIYFFAWLRCGYKVAVISTACQSNAIRHLLKACSASIICYDPKHERSVDEALSPSQDDPSHVVLRIELEHTSLEDLQRLQSTSLKQIPSAISVEPSDITLYGHSSGTSTGLPKPIPITHQDEIGALPRFHQVKNYQQPNSTFSTTPIYTGGLADLWRSWSAGTTLWTYAENKVPITAENIIRYRSAVEAWIAKHQENAASIGYVSCVPFVVQLMTEQNDLLDWLRSMKMVGVGGAAMPPKLGDMLVEQGVNLVSRFGSRECGFLLSSDRDYSTDKEWQYLRHDTRVESIVFKQWNDVDSELLVDQTWPSRSPAIRSKSPFNSHDLFTPHHTLKNAWRYNGRSDVQITLTTGKKFDPAGIEAGLTVSEWIQDAVVVGNDRPLPAAIIFSSTQAESLEEIERRERILEAVSRINKECPAHARLKNNMVLILPSDRASGIQKSSKGTVMRGRFAEDFSDSIRQLYSEDQSRTTDSMLDALDHRELLQAISAIVRNESGVEIANTNQDFFAAGIDSTMSMQIRRQVRARLPAHLQAKVPLNMVYNAGTIDALTSFVAGLSKDVESGSFKQGKDINRRRQDIENLLAQIRLNNWSDETDSVPVSMDKEVSAQSVNTVLLTGATGFLGAHILDNLVTRKEIKHIVCLIRRRPKMGQDQEALHRVMDTFSSYGLTYPSTTDGKVTCVYSDLEQENLGLDSKFTLELMPRVTHLIHAAWAVNFSLPLASFGAQLKGLLNLYNLARLGHRPISFMFVSSTASILAGNPPVMEELSRNPSDCSDSGYGQSKWAAESLLTTLTGENAQPKVSIIRVGQLTANRKTGAWNMQEAWPLMLDASFNVIPRRAGKVIMPDLANINNNELDWLPVDLAAEIVVDLLCKDIGGSIGREPTVFHVLCNCTIKPTWSSINNWLSQAIPDQEEHNREEVAVELISPTEWLDMLEAEGDNERKHLALSLVPLWRSAWIPSRASEHKPKFSTLRTEEQSQSMKHANSINGAVDRQAFLKMLRWLQSYSRGLQ